MDDFVKEVEKYYNESVMEEWKRLADHPIEFIIAKHYLDKYIKPGESVLDIGGGPGRYTLYLASKGCQVTLVDLAEENTLFAKAQAAANGVSVHTYVGDARFVNQQIHQTFDHILLMGPLYHLLDEPSRHQAMQAALALLKPGGIIYVSFISLYSGMGFAMKNAPAWILDSQQLAYAACYMHDETYEGDAFTKACFMKPADIVPWMAQFPFTKLHLLGQESIIAPYENIINAQPAPIFDKWVETAIAVAEREAFLAFSDHIMYIGQKTYDKE